MSQVVRSLVVASIFALVSTLPASAAWQQTTVSNFGNSDSEASSTARSPSGGTYVAWQSQGSDDLYWAKRTATGWRKTQVAGQNSFVACYSTDPQIGPSTAFAADGTAMIASACDDFGSGSKVLFSKLTANGWVTKKAGYGPTSSCEASASDVDLLLSSSGKPAIFITEPCTKAVTGFFKKATGWKKVAVLPGGCCSAFRYLGLSFAVDPSNGNIALTENGDIFGRAGLEFDEFTWSGTLVGGSQHFFTLPNGDAPYGEPSLTFAADGTAYVAFQEGSAYGTPADQAYSFLTLVTRSAGVWGAPTTVDASQTLTGGEPSMVLDANGFHIAYQDDSHHNLRYANSSDGVTWSFQTIVGKGDTGRYPSLAVAPDGTASISFYNRADTSLRSVTGS